ncbi:MAG: M28 family metallopeptidase [Planctomycetota bacterium]
MNNIIFNEHNAYKLLNQISFVRLGGTAAEKKAADILKGYLSSLGIKPKEETFKVETYQEIAASLEVMAPYRKKYEVNVVGCTGSTPANGITGELVHLNYFDTEHIQTAKGKIAMIYNRLINKIFYQKLVRHKVKALIRVVESSSKLSTYKQNDLFIKAFGKILSVLLGYENALEIVHKGAKNVRLVARQKEFKATSRNITATLCGTELPNEKIIICGHYDSVDKSPGSLDNGTGSATIAEFARYFAIHPPKRTIEFIWFGSEEIGLKGSEAYVKRHQKELLPPKRPVLINSPQVKLLINVDVVGPIFGHNVAYICGSDAMAHFVESFAKEKGLPFNTRHLAYSSDNIAFNDKGIPSISFARESGVLYGHSPLDTIHLINPDGLKIMGQFGLELLSRIVNAAEIPFSLNIPESDKKLTSEYIEHYDPFYKGPQTGQGSVNKSGQGL